MAKRVAVIDLGSNSARLAVFERTSRFGFYILAEHKIKVRLGEGAYENGGVLQEAAIQKCFLTFSDFKRLIKSYGANRVLCVGTSALRDAPNAKEFINLIKKNLGINIRVIDGDSEAHLGGIAALNLLSKFTEAITVDIGGGSTELAHIVNGRVVETISLNVGTVRLKELFYDKNRALEAREFIRNLVEKIPNSFRSENLIAIGGSLRAISGAIMSSQNYPLKLVHNYKYDYEKNRNFIEKIANSKALELNKFDIKKDRYDTIREGACIFGEVAKKLGSKNIITSGVGVREGVFLSSILGHNAKLPGNFNVSLRSLMDRFMIKNSSKSVKFAKMIFEVLSPIHGVDRKFLDELISAVKLANIGLSLGFYAKHAHASYFVQNALNYGYTHEQKVLISSIIKLHGKREMSAEYDALLGLLPDSASVIWLSFIAEFAKILSDGCDSDEVKMSFTNSTLQIYGVKNCLFLKESIKKMSKPAIFAITFS